MARRFAEAASRSKSGCKEQPIRPSNDSVHLALLLILHRLLHPPSPPPRPPPAADLLSSPWARSSPSPAAKTTAAPPPWPKSDGPRYRARQTSDRPSLRADKEKKRNRRGGRGGWVPSGCQGRGNYATGFREFRDAGTLSALSP